MSIQEMIRSLVEYKNVMDEIQHKINRIINNSEYDEIFDIKFLIDNYKGVPNSLDRLIELLENVERESNAR